MKNVLINGNNTNNINGNIFKTFIIDIVIFTIINLVLITVVKNIIYINQDKRNIYSEMLDRNKYEILLKTGHVLSNSGSKMSLIGFLNTFSNLNNFN